MTVSPNNTTPSFPKHGITLPTVENKHDEFFKLITKLDKGDVVYRQDCKFCNHPIKAEAEAKWEAVNRSYSPIMRMLEEYRKEHPDAPRMIYSNVRNHLLNHFDQAQRKKMMKEYGDSLLAVLNYKRSTDYSLEGLKAGLEMRFMEIASNRSLDELRSADMMVKVAKTIAELIKTQAELRGEIKVVNIFMEKFRNVYIAKINEASDEDKPKLLEILENIQGELDIS